ncbi:MAG: hypothetical protein AUG13_00120 [Chloroflexi bacterium 13_1_20CM_2_59_7]|nr:MAG: hypothetical protein AUG13_00120 [Chloroflexi bacterium 13_1_20CM_2_59_7]
MKRVVLLLFLTGWLVPLASAQDHFQVGAYGDYFRITQTNTDMAGLGGRAAVKLFSHVMVEGEMSYDFEQAFTERCLSSGCTVTVANSNLKVLHGLVGPKFIGGRHAIRPFLAVKGGFINFQLNPRPASFSGFVSSVANLRSNNVSAVLYPALGAEGHLGPIGLRLEAGDEMYFAGSTHHNPRVAFGPFLRF